MSFAQCLFNDECDVREMAENDLAMVLAWRNHPAIRRFMFSPEVIDAEEHRKWFEYVKHDETRRLLIAQYQKQPIGFVQFHLVGGAGVADWGFYVRPDAPKGSGMRLGLAALTYAYCDMQLHKVCGQAIEGNQASVGFHKKLGFKQEGFLRDQKLIGGERHNLVCFGLLATEWKAEQELKGTIDV